MEATWIHENKSFQSFSECKSKKNSKRNKKSFKIWDWLPNDLKTAATLDDFKHGLDALMKTERWNKVLQQL
jgi:hypothetical protein